MELHKTKNRWMCVQNSKDPEMYFEIVGIITKRKN